jgi:hypothetical protein
MDRVVHREVVPASNRKFLAWLQKTFCIRYTDGTTLELHLREANPRERVQVKDGYSSLIRDCFHYDVNSVDKLCDLKQEKRTA